jgi:predicted nucleic acid-binding protein
MNRVAAVLDSCVLFSAALRDLFMRLAGEGVFHARWTEGIHEEWIRSVLQQRPDLRRPQLERTRELMDMHAEGSLVANYQALIPTLTLPDPDDRHILAAAIVSEASFIVTFNLADFPTGRLEPHGVTAVHPDQFLVELAEATPESFLQAVRGHRAALRNPPKSPEQYVATLVKLGLANTGKWLDLRLDTL